MPRVYATRADLVAHAAGSTWNVPGDPLVTRLLTEASGVVDDALVGAVYDTDTATLLPTSSSVAEALRDAVCAQVLAVGESGGYSTGSGGGGYTTVKVGSVSLTREAGASDQAVVAPSELAPSAARILRRAGLCTYVWS